jgi:hypothetical protein
MRRESTIRGGGASDNALAYSSKIRYDKEDPKIREEYYKELRRTEFPSGWTVDQGGA